MSGKAIDIPADNGSSGSHNNNPREIPTGRALSPTEIQQPTPQKPYARGLLEGPYSISSVDDDAGDDEFDVDDCNMGDGSMSDSNVDDGNPADRPACPRSTDNILGQSGQGKDNLDLPSSQSEGCQCGRYRVLSNGERVLDDCGGSKCDNISSGECSETSEDEGGTPYTLQKKILVVKK